MSIKEAVEALKKGSKVSFKNDDSANVHQAIGKVSFTVEQLQENYKAFSEMLQKARPEAMKGRFIHSIAVCSTMGPSIKVKM